MKKIVFIISTCLILMVGLSSCYIESDYGYHHPYYHHHGWEHEHEGWHHDRD